MALKCLSILAVVSLGGCGGSLYHSNEAYHEPKGSEVLLLSYYGQVESSLVVSLQKAASAGKVPTDGSHDSKAADAEAVVPSFSLVVSALNVQSRRRFLYFKNGAFYNSSVEFATSASGLPSKSDTTSTQTVTAILGEIGQTAGAALQAAGHAAFFSEVTKLAGPLNHDELKLACAQHVADLAPLTITSPLTSSGKINDIPIGDVVIKTVKAVDKESGKVVSLDVKDTLKIYLGVEDSDTSDPYQGAKRLGKTALTDQRDEDVDAASRRGEFDGFSVYDPSFITVTPRCADETDQVGIQLGEPHVYTVYRYSHVVNPQRAFWTSPQDTYTISEGIITGHKFTDQSAAKTAVDLVTSPVRALLPSTQTTTTVQLQTGGGKPDQTTSTTATQVSAPKP